MNIFGQQGINSYSIDLELYQKKSVKRWREVFLPPSRFVSVD